MRVTALQEYGLRCMAQLAAQKIGIPLAVRSIARRERLTPVYVEKILVSLRQAGLVKSVRGVNGGYLLARPGKDISVADVLTALGHVNVGRDLCGRFTGSTPVCVHEGDCRIRPIWSLLARTIQGFMERITLDQLVKSEPNKTPHLKAVDNGGHAVPLPAGGRSHVRPAV